MVAKPGLKEVQTWMREPTRSQAEFGVADVVAAEADAEAGPYVFPTLEQKFSRL